MDKFIQQIKVGDLHTLFPDFSGENLVALSKSLRDWTTEDDEPVFRFLYQAHRPYRHLEFGTWQGGSAKICLESCEATVWTINLPDGEDLPNGGWAYGQRAIEGITYPSSVVSEYLGEDELGPVHYHRTDAGGYIGHIYKENGMGNRVCQIYCDSRSWDNSNFPEDFFDSVLIDGGHSSDVVVSDTRKALQVLRPGGLMMWHDFCPVEDFPEEISSVKGVTLGIKELFPELQNAMQTLTWINPSWILLGIKKTKFQRFKNRLFKPKTLKDNLG